MFKARRGGIKVPDKKYFQPEFDPKCRCKCANPQDFRDCFVRGTVDSQEAFIHSSKPVYDSRIGSFSVFYREMRAHCEQFEKKQRPVKVVRSKQHLASIKFILKENLRSCYV